MNSKMIIGVVVIVLLVIGGYYYFLQLQYGSKPQSPSAPQAPSALEPTAKPPIPAPTPVQAPAPTPAVKLAPSPSTAGVEMVELTAGGFSPPMLTIPVGTTVKFINKDSQSHWPASSVHPTHQICPGLDSLRPLEPGDSYSFTFKIAKTCPMHDHLNPGTRGTIAVQ